MPAKKEWPKELVVCLECGEPGTEDGGFARYCSNGGEHGPTQQVSVVPASSMQEVRDALEFAEAQLRGGVVVGKVPPRNVMRAYDRIDATLQNANEVLGGQG
jgi:hypothetical protein